MTGPVSIAFLEAQPLLTHRAPKRGRRMAFLLGLVIGVMLGAMR